MRKFFLLLLIPFIFIVIGCSSNDVSGFKKLEESAINGDPDAQNDLGFLYFNKNNLVDLDYQKAQYFFELSAKNGNVEAMNNLGVMYLEGLGVEKNYTRAKEYFELAISKDTAQSFNNLGLMYAQGLGVPIDYVKARDFFSKAIYHGYEDANHNLNHMNSLGQGIDTKKLSINNYDTNFSNRKIHTGPRGGKYRINSKGKKVYVKKKK